MIEYTTEDLKKAARAHTQTHPRPGIDFFREMISTLIELAHGDSGLSVRAANALEAAAKALANESLYLPEKDLRGMLVELSILVRRDRQAALRAWARALGLETP